MAQNGLQYGITRRGRPSGGAVPLRRPERAWTRIRRALGGGFWLRSAPFVPRKLQENQKCLNLRHSNHYLGACGTYTPPLWRLLLTFPVTLLLPRQITSQLSESWWTQWKRVFSMYFNLPCRVATSSGTCGLRNLVFWTWKVHVGFWK